MHRTFQIFHLSLIQGEQRDLFGRDVSREQWLREILSRRIEFSHRQKNFFWVPKSINEGDIVGIIERETPQAQHRPPEQGGGEFIGALWQGATIIIDPTHHDSGQRLAFEIDRAVGGANAILASFLQNLNRSAERPYTIEHKPVFDATSFWAFAERHGRRLRRVTFDFVVPNMWGAEEGLDKDLKETGKDTGAERVKVDLQSQDGIKTDSERVISGVKYSEKGGGTLTAKSLEGERFSSMREIKQTNIDDGGEVRPGEEQTVFWKRLAGRILGRE